MPKSVLKFVNIPAQVQSEAEAEAIKEAGDVAVNSLAGTLGGGLVMNFFASTSLSYMWSAVNNLQVIMLFGLFDLKAPGNVLAFL